MADETDHRPHFIVDGFTSTESYLSPGSGPKRKPIPPRDRDSHGASLLGQIEALKAVGVDGTEAPEEPEGLDLQVEFEGFPNIELAFESLAREASGIELRNVRHDGDVSFATVFVPAGKLSHFEGLIRDYLERKVDKIKRPRDHQRLIDAIRAIRLANVRALWTDDPTSFPDSDEEQVWWEVWFPSAGDKSHGSTSFRELASGENLVVAPGELVFPERTVVLVRGSIEQLQSSALILNSIAELRRAKETADFFDNLDSDDQAARLNIIVSNATFAAPDGGAPHVCLLDTGVNRTHPLLSPALADGDMHSIEPAAWGVADDHGHGTQMAGLALCGDLTDVLIANESLDLKHRLESVKILQTNGGNVGDARFHGYLTVEGVARPEITAPGRRRVFGMAITANDRRDRGRPSAWSAAIDRLSSDSDGLGNDRRLLVLSAGNIDTPHAWDHYPSSNDTDSIQDPGQAWNALTVGACTHMVDVSDDGELVPIAEAGGLSPFSTTSFTWEPQWPLKPDVVFEGGNAARDAFGAAWTQSLSLLTTGNQPLVLPFATARATSAATALAARFAARIMAEYPALWPETVRGLTVHSADWTEQMRRQYLPNNGPTTKSDYVKLIRRCGFGVPDIDLALWSARNSLTLIAQKEITPFKREPGKGVTLRDLHLHSLPWPKDLLEGYGETEVEMRVTLSYFVEPNPSARGVKSRYSYQSHGLRFDSIRPTESIEKFRKRVNLAARDGEEDTPDAPEDTGWYVGKQGRSRGSIHSDLWSGRAVDLASRGVIAVYPSSGWWKTRQHLQQYDRSVHYSLIVSIRATKIDVDLYTEIANQITSAVSIET